MTMRVAVDNLCIEPIRLASVGRKLVPRRWSFACTLPYMFETALSFRSSQALDSHLLCLGVTVVLHMFLSHVLVPPTDPVGMPLPLRLSRCRLRRRLGVLAIASPWRARVASL